MARIKRMPPHEKQGRNLNTRKKKEMHVLFLLFLVLIIQRTSGKRLFGIGWTSLIDTLHSLALPLTPTAWSLLRDPLVLNLPPAPDSRISGFEVIAGFCSSEQPEDSSLFLLLFVYARLGFFEVTVIHHEDVGGHHGFHFPVNGLSEHQIPSPLLGCVKWRDAFGLGIVLCVCESLCLEVICISAVNCKAT